MDLPPVDEVISSFDSSTQASNIKQKMNALTSKGFTQEQLCELNTFIQELLVKISEINQLEFNVLSAIAQAVEFVPFSTRQLQEYIDENEDYNDIREEVIYIDSAAFTAEGIIDRCIITIAELLGVEDFDSEFVADNRDYIIDECISLDGCDCIDDILTSNSSVYNHSVFYVAHWVRIAITEYLKETTEDDEVDSWFDEQESLLLEPYYEVMRKLAELNVF